MIKYILMKHIINNPRMNCVKYCYFRDTIKHDLSPNILLRKACSHGSNIYYIFWARKTKSCLYTTFKISNNFWHGLSQECRFFFSCFCACFRLVQPMHVQLEVCEKLHEPNIWSINIRAKSNKINVCDEHMNKHPVALTWYVHGNQERLFTWNKHTYDNT